MVIKHLFCDTSQGFPGVHDPARSGGPAGRRALRAAPNPYAGPVAGRAPRLRAPRPGDPRRRPPRRTSHPHYPRRKGREGQGGVVPPVSGGPHAGLQSPVEIRPSTGRSRKPLGRPGEWPRSPHDRPVSPHTLQHSPAGHWFACGMPINGVSQCLGQKAIRPTGGRRADGSPSRELTGGSVRATLGRTPAPRC